MTSPNHLLDPEGPEPKKSLKIAFWLVPLALLGAALIFVLACQPAYGPSLDRTKQTTPPAEQPAQKEIKTSPQSAPNPNRFVRAETLPRLVLAQVFVGPRRAEDIGALLDQVVAEGYNSVALRLFHHHGDRVHGSEQESLSDRQAPALGVYFRTEHAPLVEDLAPLWQKMAHDRGLLFFGWMSTRRSPWLEATHPEWMDRSYDPEAGRMPPIPMLDLGQEEVVTYLHNLYKDMEPVVDGVLLQDDLVYRQMEGFGNGAIAAHFQRYGKRIDPGAVYQNLVREQGRYRLHKPTEAYRAFCRFRGDLMLDTISTVRSALKDKYLAANLYYDTALNPDQGLRWLCQDLKAYGLHEGIDYLAVMGYHRQIREERGFTEKKLRDALSTMADELDLLGREPQGILFKYQSIDWSTKKHISEQEISAIRQHLSDRGYSEALAPYHPDTMFTGHLLPQPAPNPPGEKP